MELRRTNRLYSGLVAEARHREPPDAMEIASLMGEWDLEGGLLQEEYDVLYTDALVRKAEGMRVPIPSYPSGSEEDAH